MLLWWKERGSRWQKRGSETDWRSFRKGKGCFRLWIVGGVSSWIWEGLWHKCICPLRNQSQTQEVGGKSLPKSLSCHMPLSPVGTAAAQTPLVGRQDRTLSVPWPQPHLQWERREKLKFFPVTEHIRMWQLFGVTGFLWALAANKDYCLEHATLMLVQGEETRRTRRQASFIPWFMK